MEFFVNKSSVRNLQSAPAVARETAKISGRPVLFHLFDFMGAILFHGCSDNQYLNEVFFRLRSFDRRNTITKCRKDKICTLFNDKNYAPYFNDKVLFNKTFKDFVKRNWIYTRETSREQLDAFINKHSRIIVKPIDQNKGKGIRLLDKNNFTESIVSHLLSEDVLLEECITQHPDMIFGNKSVNSIRVITVLDGYGNVHILKAGLRCGVGEAIVDNFSAGGVLYPLNLEGGFVDGYGEVGGHYEYGGIHPGTDCIMMGRTIPHWSKVINIVKKAALLIPQIRYVGWDVAILKDDVELIEGNNGPGCTLLECVGGKRGFYKEILSYL